jgi:hypothetical protein
LPWLIESDHDQSVARLGASTHVAWVDSVLHRVMPIAVMGDWLVDPPRAAITFRRALVWLGFPLAWTAFTLIRGAIDGHYPYPFLDPANGGYGLVAVYCVGIFGLFVFIVWLAAIAGSAIRERRTG